MSRENESELSAGRRRWSERAKGWDEAIEDPEHYANYQDGYDRFYEFELRHLERVGHAVNGIGKVNNLYLVDISEKMLQEAKKKMS